MLSSRAHIVLRLAAVVLIVAAAAYPRARTSAAMRVSRQAAVAHAHGMP